MKVVDCFIYNNEIQLLRARLEYLRDSCDLHIVVESNRYFSGAIRQFSSVEEEELCAQFPGKIVWVKFNDESLESTPWEREASQRNHISLHLNDLGKEDLILLSDADEIPSRHFIEQAKLRLPEYSIAKMRHFQYCQHLNNPNHSHTTIAFPLESLCFSIQELRIRAIKYWENPQDIIENAGWHLSSFGDSAAFVDKIKHFSHQEFNKFPYTTISYSRLLQYLGLQIDGSYFLDLIKNPGIPFDTGFICHHKHGIQLRDLLRKVIQPIVALIFVIVVKYVSTPIIEETTRTQSEGA
jgi:beta-1,4-mannosyl-glycoprotein beta-1,4-N-acetylglucosaminyltransferase